MSDFGNWMQAEFADTSVARNPYRYSVPRAMSEVRSNVSPAVGVSVEEKVSDLIQMLVPARASMLIWLSTRTFRTPMWARPRANPPPSANPRRGRRTGFSLCATRVGLA